MCYSNDDKFDWVVFWIWTVFWIFLAVPAVLLTVRWIIVDSLKG